MLSKKKNKKMRQQLSLFKISGHKTILAGAIPGRNLLSNLIKAVAPPPEPSAIFLNFKGVRSATASFLREVVLGFRDYCLNSRLALYPVVANANQEIIEELEIVLEVQNDAVVICKLSENDVATSVKVIGRLEEKQEITLNAVFKIGEVDATALSRTSDDNGVGSTAWNNRLAALAGRGLVIEEKKGRGKFYRPVLEMK
jgi:hypothetical protein